MKSEVKEMKAESEESVNLCFGPVPKKLRDEFKIWCIKHSTTMCQKVLDMMHGVLKGKTKE